MIRILQIILCALLFTGSYVCASDEWSAGSIALLDIRGSMQISTFEGSEFLDEAAELPIYRGGIFRLFARGTDALYASASNGLQFRFTGPGYCAAERFEQMLSGDGKIKTRSIFSLRQGRLIIDDRVSGGQSSLVLETPLGRVNGPSSLWAMNIQYDESSRRYNFQIECAEGNLRFTDLSGQVYNLRSRQRLSGAGTSTSPSIEAAEFTNDEEELFESFFALVESKKDIEVSAAELQAKMRPLQRVAKSAGESIEIEPEKVQRARPLVIEYEPAPAPVTPFRGNLKPPAEWEEGIF